MAAVVWFAVVPALGLFAEIMLGALSSWLGLFPTWWHVGFVIAAVAANALLHAGAFATSRWLPLRAALTGGTAGMALLYALAEAPAVPAMFLMAWTGLGILAMAPYLVGLGMLRLVPHLWRSWLATGRSPAALGVLLAVLTLLPTVLEVGARLAAVAAADRFAALAAAMRDPARATAVEALAARVRNDDVAIQRAMCRDGFGWRDGFGSDFWWFDGGPPARHLADGRSFWFLRRWRAASCAPLDAARAFHRAHGCAWDDAVAEPRAAAAISRLAWLGSRVLVRPEADAALAYVEHLLDVGSSSARSEEAWFDLRVPAGAVASALSLWIDGHERPAAFAASATVAAAYAAVARTDRDPALLQELSPGVVRLRLFPLNERLPAMRVRVGFTVPLRVGEDGAELALPRVVAHNCALVPRRHQLVFGGAGAAAPRPVDDRQLAQPIRVPRGAMAAQARDADGWVMQRLVPREPLPAPARWFVVVEASASVRRTGADVQTLLAALPASAPVVLFVAHGDGCTRVEGAAGSPECDAFLRGVPFAGGVDARPALAAVIDEAAAGGGGTVLWLHGTAASLPDGVWPVVPPAVTLAAFALAPGRNAVHEHLAGDPNVVDVPRHGDAPTSLVAALQEFVRHGGRAIHEAGAFERRWARAAAPAAGVVVVSDQLARLWGAVEARNHQRAGRAKDAVALAARYRVVTAGAGAVVLENAGQYAAYGLDPGAPVGTEPRGLVGASGPVPEWSTWLMLATGLLAVCWWRRPRAP
jgi:hypothetical protein